MRFGSLVRSVFACAAMLLISAGPAVADSPPHVAATVDTDVCAMCHRVKTSASLGVTEWSRVVASETGDAGDVRNALLVGLGEDDTGLCLSCHGVDRLGSATDVQRAFEATSHHILAPEPSAYGRSPKQCSTCHDSHGTNKVDGAPRPALLRSIVSTSEVHYSGPEYCASCHPDRPLDRWDGLDVFTQTVHASRIPTPASGTGIVCSVCHDPHGSPIAPSIVTSIMPPAVLPPGGVGVSRNDRTFCFLCHLYPGGSAVDSATYATSSHGMSTATVTIAAEYPLRYPGSVDTSRLVGECQNCHSPMGSRDGTSPAAVPRLLEKPGRTLCDDCHDSDGPARSDIATLAYPAARADVEVVAVWRPSAETSVYGDVAVYTQDITEAVPAGLEGPRVFAPTQRTGDADAGDIDGLPGDELVVADPSRAGVDVFFSDPLKGLRRRSFALPGGMRGFALELANVVATGAGPHGAQDARAELAVVERDPLPPHASRLHVLTFSGSAFETLTPSAGLPLDPDASDIAAGDLNGDGKDELVVTSFGDPGASPPIPPSMRIFTESGATVAQMGPTRALPDGSQPLGVSVGDVWAGDPGNEIVVCFSGFDADNVGVFSGTGSQLATYTAGGNTGAERPYASVVADLLWNEPRDELIVAVRSDPTTDSISATSSVSVFTQVTSGSGLAVPPSSLDTGLRYESAALAAGDVDRDGRVEVVVGNAGRWRRDGTGVPPSLMLLDAPGGSTPVLSSPRWSTGVEQASGLYETTTTALGTAPSVVVADLGTVGPSRHPVDAAPVAHSSTETAGFARHVTCADCHDPHEATATVQTTAPALYGALKGVWGARFSGSSAGTYTVSTDTSPTAEFEVCLKCHSVLGALDGSRDVAAEVATGNASVHAVLAPSATASAPASTFVTPTAGQFVNAVADGSTNWTKDSQLFCIDCHTDSDPSQAKGPHVSGAGSLLRAPFWGVLPSAASDGFLCYLCHKRSIYYDGQPGSLFYHVGKPDMHRVHTKDAGFSCRTCHVAHGSATLPHLQNADHAYEHFDTGGACTTECHTGGARHAYSRVPTTTAPSSLAVSNAATYTGDLASLVARDGVELVVQEGNGSGADYSIELTFTGVPATPAGVEFYGRYQGSPGHTVRVRVWDFSIPGWVNRGIWPSTAVRGVFTFPLGNANYVSGGTARIQILHDSPGNPTHQHFIDSAWLYY